jgi:hypothetical protein
MIVRAFPDAGMYQKLYWTMIGYVPPPAAPGNTTVAPRAYGGARWKAGYTVGKCMRWTVGLTCGLGEGQQ